eukprot:TRINITY_DN143_c0_g2_i1.p1 TRINITY_DN143_c0_g2~~TRINITY_DN143_c0_g2_i1.p1  ORF type:complete len:382 (+),score=41.14 TRINITY_DN143_c0_g2_i1:256-1401(+)
MLAEATTNLELPSIVRDELLQPSLDSARLLQSLINDILDYHQIQHRKLRLAKVEFDIREKVRDISRLFQIQSKERSVNFFTCVDDDVPIEIRSEPTRLSQILINIIGNSFKFTPKDGHIVLKVTLGPERRYLSFSIADSGIGMTEENVKKLFKAFGRVEGDELSRRMNPQGVGLGLSIANCLVGMLGGGSIQVESSPSAGTKFSFDLPLDERSLALSDLEIENHLPNSTSVRIKSPLLAVKMGTGEHCCLCNRVLIADDNDYNLMVLGRQLHQRSIQTIKAHDGDEAIKIVIDLFEKAEDSCGREDCRRLVAIILDWDMPRMNGLDAARELKRLMHEGSIRFIPTLLCSAFDNPGSNDFIDGFLLKPLSPQSLEEALRQLR